MASLPTDWKMGKCLEWHTYLPLSGRPQTSPTFFYQNVECYFCFCRSKSSEYYASYQAYFYHYELYLKTKRTDTQLKPFSFTVYAADEGEDRLAIRSVSFSDCNRYLFRFPEAPFKSKAVDLSCGLPVKYIFVFDNDGLLLPSEITTDEKSSQADLMLCLQTDVEYLSLDFGELLKNGKHSDVQLLCNGGNIPAHKAILAARSKAFSDMFKENTEESKSGLINLSTTEVSVMEFCLEYIYKGKILKLPVEKASNLYVLGHVFKIHSLAKMCADLMVSNLSEENYIPCLILADKYDDDYLKCSLTEYISNHVNLLKSENWMKFADEYMKTAIHVYKKCMFH